MSGTAALGLPYISPQFIGRSTHQQFPSMTFTAPIHNQTAEVIAAFAQRVDPRLEFTRMTELARLDKTRKPMPLIAIGDCRRRDDSMSNYEEPEYWHPMQSAY